MSLSAHIPRLGVAVHHPSTPDEVGIVVAVLDEDRDLWKVVWAHDLSSGECGKNLVLAEPASEDEIKRLAAEYVDHPTRDTLWIIDVLDARDPRLDAVDTFLGALRDIAASGDQSSSGEGDR